MKIDMACVLWSIIQEPDQQPEPTARAKSQANSQTNRPRGQQQPGQAKKGPFKSQEEILPSLISLGSISLDRQTLHRKEYMYIYRLDYNITY